MIPEQIASYRWVLLSTLAALTLSAGCPAVAPAEDDPAAYTLQERFKITRGDDPLYSLIDTEFLSVPRCLMGVELDEDGNIYICDNITEKLIKLAPDGRELFAVGSKGEGPEDHLDAGEPLFWPGCHVARSDCSSDPKVILYDESGAFIRSISLEGYSQYNRIWFAGDQAVAVAMKMDGYPAGGMTIEVFLVTFGPGGKLKKELKLKEVSLPPMESGQIPKETDFEVIPRIAIGQNGVIYMQRDLYRYEIECFDAGLNLLWVCERDVAAPRRSDAEIAKRKAKIDGFLQICEHNHVLKHIVPRPGGEVWLERTDQGSARPGEIVLDRIDAAGNPAGHASISGMPEWPGQYIVRGDRLLWMVDDDVDAQGGEIPYLIVYELTPAE